MTFYRDLMPTFTVFTQWMLIVFSTYPSRALALKSAKAIVREKLGACVQVSGPIQSVYSWNGKTESSREFLLSIKTRPILFRKLERFISKNHPYDTPEVVSVKVQSASAKYLAWVKKST